eukprot:Amastigsp_a5549_4.p4 type:complete len:144 gc:universal Amastigsp_a5549_4:463-32(-)
MLLTIRSRSRGSSRLAPASFSSGTARSAMRASPASMCRIRSAAASQPPTASMSRARKCHSILVPAWSCRRRAHKRKLLEPSLRRTAPYLKPRPVFQSLPRAPPQQAPLAKGTRRPSQTTPTSPTSPTWKRLLRSFWMSEVERG